MRTTPYAATPPTGLEDRHLFRRGQRAGGQGERQALEDRLWCGLPAAEASPRLRQALARVPPQADMWSCGANCAARMLWLSGQPVPDYDAFLRSCPQSFGPQTPADAHPLARLWGLRWLLRKLLPPVGPHPRLLARYLSLGCPPGSAAQVVTSGDFAGCQAAACAQVGRGAPFMALWYRSFFHAHYVVVIDVDVRNDTWSVINNGERILLTSAQMAKQMDCARCLWGRCVGLGRFNIIALTSATDDAPA